MLRAHTAADIRAAEEELAATLPEGELIVNSSRGGGTKDTWVLAGPTSTAPAPPAQQQLQMSDLQAVHDEGHDEGHESSGEGSVEGVG